MRKFRAAIFDLDGTLACTFPDLFACANHMLKSKGYPTRSEDEVMQSINLTEYEYIKSLLPAHVQQDKATVDRCVADYSAYYGAHFADKTYLYEGLAEVLEKLRAAGIPMAVHTNKKHLHASELVEKLVPKGVFSTVIGEGVCKAKPHPEGALLLAEKMGVDPVQVCFIGDSNVDVETAKNAGMFSLAVTWGYRSAEFLLAAGADALAEKAEDILGYFDTP